LTCNQKNKNNSLIAQEGEDGFPQKMKKIIEIRFILHEKHKNQIVSYIPNSKIFQPFITKKRYINLSKWKNTNLYPSTTENFVSKHKSI